MNLDDLPPPILSGGVGGGPQPTISAPPTQGGAPQKTKDDVISDDELMSWAGSGEWVWPVPVSACYDTPFPCRPLPTSTD